jgi:hypothetical protein
MSLRTVLVPILFGSLLLAPPILGGDRRPADLPRKIAPFTLKHPRDGKTVSLAGLKES